MDRRSRTAAPVVDLVVEHLDKVRDGAWILGERGRSALAAFLEDAAAAGTFTEVVTELGRFRAFLAKKNGARAIEAIDAVAMEAARAAAAARVRSEDAMKEAFTVFAGERPRALPGPAKAPRSRPSSPSRPRARSYEVS